MTTQAHIQQCIELCLRAAAECQECASFCLREDDVNMMAKCIQLDMECATMCYAAAQMMSLNSQFSMEICRLCAEVCEACAKECSLHDVDHCERCAIECNACAEQCRKMESTLIEHSA